MVGQELAVEVEWVRLGLFVIGFSLHVNLYYLEEFREEGKDNKRGEG